MSDLKLAWNPVLLTADLALSAAGLDLAGEIGLETAVVLSLFTDARAGSADALPGAPDDRRGWWGDVSADVEGDEIGSRLWLLAREKELPQVLVKARQYADEALAWFVEDGLARRVEVAAEVPRREVLGLSIALYRPDGRVARYSFELFWKGL